MFFSSKMCFSNINFKPDKNPKPERVKPEPDFEKSQKPDPSPNPTILTRAGPEPDYLKPVTSLVVVVRRRRSVRFLFPRITF